MEDGFRVVGGSGVTVKLIQGKQIIMYTGTCSTVIISSSSSLNGVNST